MERYELSDISKLLTERTLKNAFRSYRADCKEDPKLVEVNRAAPPGDGLISAVYRVVLTADNCRGSFVVKSLIRDALLRRTLRCDLFFRREVKFYEEILPLLMDVQKTTGAKERIQNYVPVYYGSRCDGVDDYIVLEDLVESGYSGIDANEPLTRPHLKLALHNLAHVHACSFTLRILRPDVLNCVIAGLRPEMFYCEDNRAWYQPYLNNAIHINMEALAIYEPPTKSVYWDKLNKLLDRGIYSQLMEMGMLESDMSVVSNGDVWAPNFMFSKERAVLFDFQTVRFVPPACDLSYLLFCCCDHEFKKTDLDEAVDEYYNSLGYFLNDMGLSIDKIYWRGEFNADFQRWAKYGLLMSFSTIPLSASKQRCDTMQSFSERFRNYDRIPLEMLWPLKAYEEEKTRLRFVNIIRLAVDSKII